MKVNVVFLLLVLAAGQTPKASAQSPGIFTVTGSMMTPRNFQTATLLPDGRVLIAGGESRDAITGAFKIESSAELYDPRTGKFSATGNMTTPRSRHTATLLPDGRVLIAGGARIDANSPLLILLFLASAEIFDPGTGRFSAAGEMSTARSTATLLNNGKVLFASGSYQDGGAELYDPVTGAFTVTGNMNLRWVDSATLLPNGKVLFTMSLPPDEPYTSWAELYDPSTGAFTATGYATTNHTSPTAALLMNGKVLLAGGDIGDGDGASLIAELYDPATGAFSRTGNLTAGRSWHSATLLPGGTVLFAGSHEVVDLSASAEIYDPFKESFSRTASMPTPREGHRATLLSDGRILIAGGVQLFPGAIESSALLYTPAELIPAPVLLSFSGDGKGQGAILHANTSHAASSDSPATVGQALEIYLTGLGDGNLIPPQVSIGGRTAEVLWFGNTPGYAGLNQINVRVPAGLAPGPAVPVRLTCIGRPSNEVTMGVR